MCVRQRETMYVYECMHAFMLCQYMCVCNLNRLIYAPVYMYVCFCEYIPPLIQENSPKFEFPLWVTPYSKRVSTYPTATGEINAGNGTICGRRNGNLCLRKELSLRI